MPPSTKQAFTWSSFYERIKDVDPDLRQMALFDLQEEMKKETFQLGNEEDKCTQKLIVCFSPEESNSEVHSIAVRLLEVYVPKASKAACDKLLTQLAKNMYVKPSDIIVEKLRALRDNASLALKTAIGTLRDSQKDVAVTLCKTLVPGLASDDAKVRTEVFDVTGELVKQFGGALAESHAAIVEAAKRDVISSNAMLRKRAATCFAAISAECDNALFEGIMAFTVQGLEGSGANKRRFVQIVSAISRAAGGRFSKWVDRVAPLLFRELERLNNADDDERESQEADDTRENILQALENIIARCPLYVGGLLDNVITHATELLSWDPNYCDDMDEEFEDDDDDMELEDDDDSSWKVRKSAARLLLSVVRARADALGRLAGALLQQENAVLVARFNERIENVRLEVLDLFRGILAACRISGGGDASPATATAGSVAGLSGSFSASGEEKLRGEAAVLRALAEPVTKALVRSAKHKSAKVKQSVFLLLTDLFAILGKQLGSSVAAVTETTITHLNDPRLALPHLRPTVLDFSRVLVSVMVQVAQATEDEQVIMQLEKIVPSVVRCTEEKYYRTVVAALRVLHALVPMVQCAANGPKLAEQLFTPLLGRLTAGDADQEVRRTAMEGLAALLKDNEKTLASARASEVKQAFDLVINLLRNETTRVSAARAVAQLQRCSLDAKSINDIASELAGFLRKTDRQVREQGLRTLAGFVPVHAGTLPEATLQAVLTELVNPNVQLLNDKELFLTVLALQVANAVVAVPAMAKPGVDRLLMPIVDLLKSPLTQGGAVKNAADVLGQLGRAGNSARILEVLLKAIVAADAGALINLSTAVGAVVAAETDAKKQAGYVNDCTKMSQNASSPQTALAGIACLGDIGRYVKLSAFGADVALETALQKGNEDAKLAAASALGRAASTDIGSELLKKLVAGVSQRGPDVQLRLRAVRECLVAMSAAAPPNAITAEAPPLFNALVALTATQEGKEANDSVVEAAAECIGRLAQVVPAVVGNIRQALAGLNDFGQRAAVLSAVRFTLSHAITAPLEEAVRAALPELLTYLSHEDVRVRRAAIQLLTAAAYSRPAMIDTDKVRTETIPALLKATVVDASLIDTIDLGPFKHTVDRGLDMRKQAFECVSVFADGLWRPNSVLESSNHIPDVVARMVDSLKSDTDVDCWASARGTLVKVARHPAGATAILASADALGANLKTMIGIKAKEGQDKERVEDAARGAIICTLKVVQAVPAAAQNDKVKEAVEAAEKSPHYAKAKEALVE